MTASITGGVHATNGDFWLVTTTPKRSEFSQFGSSEDVFYLDKDNALLLCRLLKLHLKYVHGMTEEYFDG